MDEKKATTPCITIALPAGRLAPPLLAAVYGVARKHQLVVYLTTAQNLRLLDVAADKIDEIKAELVAAGATIKAPGRFPLPKVCAGRPYCKLAKADPARLSAMILARLGARTGVKPKFKIAISGCTANCSGAVSTDIGVVATAAGYDIYAGGKGGPLPRAGRRLVRQADEGQVVAVIEQLVDFHDRKTVTKQRMFKLLDEPDFPFPPAP